MVDNQILYEWIIANFNKEGIFIFFLLCCTFFGTASCLAIWAIGSGQFSDIESSKFEMMEG